MPMRVLTLELENFLSYREATLRLDDLTALVGPNASGKSSAVAAVKLLRDIPEYGLEVALLRRGGFDQVRHRSSGRPFDPRIAIEFVAETGCPPSRYSLHLGAQTGGRYEVKLEEIDLNVAMGRFTLTHRRGKVGITVPEGMRSIEPTDDFRLPPGQSAIGLSLSYLPFLALWDLLNELQLVEINPARMRELQEPSPGERLEPDGANAASVLEQLSTAGRAELADEVAAVVPGLRAIDVKRFANKLSLRFEQDAGAHRRAFLASQLLDGTLRALGVLLPLFQPRKPRLLVVEEPEISIHLGALRTLVQVLREHSPEVQVLLTTHSADIIDALDIQEVRVVWTEDGVSRLAPVASHTIETIRRGLITPGELLRGDALDPSPV